MSLLQTCWNSTLDSYHTCTHTPAVNISRNSTARTKMKRQKGHWRKILSVYTSDVTHCMLFTVWLQTTWQSTAAWASWRPGGSSGRSCRRWSIVTTATSSTGTWRRRTCYSTDTWTSRSQVLQQHSEGGLCFSLKHWQTLQHLPWPFALWWLEGCCVRRCSC